MCSRFDGILLSGQAECIPAHGMENIVPSHAFVSSYDIRCSITLGMPDMKTSATGSRKVNRSGGEKSQNQVKLWTTKLTRVGQQTSGKGTCPKRKIWVCSYPPDQVYGTSCFPTKTSAICFLYLGKGTPQLVCLGRMFRCCRRVPWRAFCD